MKAQLRWRCRRGTRELDFLLSRFLEHEYESLDATAQRAFKALLDAQDPVIMQWILGTTRPEDPVIRELVKNIRTLSERLSTKSLK